MKPWKCRAGQPRPTATMPRPIRALRDWLLSHPTGRWVVLGGCVGILCGLAAAVFEIGADVLSQHLLRGIAGVPAQVASNHTTGAAVEGSAFHPLLLLAVMAGGGLLSGLVIARWSLQARGGGIGVAVHAFHH